MKARFILIAAAFAALAGLCAFAVTRDAAKAEAAGAARPAAASEVASAPRQTGYCQVNGCIDMPQSGYCPSGYYRFQGTWCCCPIRRQAQPAGPTAAAVASAAGETVRDDFPVAFIGGPLDYGRARCGRS